MTWPVPNMPRPTNRTNSMSQVNTHPTDHNETNAAVNALEDEVGKLRGWQRVQAQLAAVTSVNAWTHTSAADNLWFEIAAALAVPSWAVNVLLTPMIHGVKVAATGSPPTPSDTLFAAFTTYLVLGGVTSGTAAHTRINRTGEAQTYHSLTWQTAINVSSLAGSSVPLRVFSSPMGVNDANAVFYLEGVSNARANCQVIFTD